MISLLFYRNTSFSENGLFDNSSTWIAMILLKRQERGIVWMYLRGKGEYHGELYGSWPKSISKKLKVVKKPFVNPRPVYSTKLVFSYVVKGIKIKITAKFCASSRPSAWRYKENYVTWNAPEKFRDFRETGHSPELLEAWLALTSVNYHRNVLVSLLLNQWLALIMFQAIGPMIAST